MNCYRCQTPLPEHSRFCLSCGADVSGETAEHTQPVDVDPELREKLQAELGSDFMIERELGRGGMAAVFLARDAHLGRMVAVKVLPPELTFGKSGGMVERFKREARTAATLDHPHVIPVYRVSTSGKLFWYVMRYLEGESLESMLRREPQLPVERAVDIVKQVAEALGYAHRRHVVHRDVKPANVMLDENGWVTVTDFGIAKALDTSSLTGSGAMIGTPYYMSPEQCSGKPVTGASDQYSLGVMTYQMLGGHLPFTGESVVDIIKKHCMDPVPPLGVLRPQLPPGMVAVVERALAKSPEERFATVTEFAKALERAAHGVAAEVTLPPQQRISDTALISPMPGALPGVKKPRGVRTVALMGAIGVVVAAATIGVSLWRRSVLERPVVGVSQPAGAPAETGQAVGPAALRAVVTPPAESAPAMRAESVVAPPRPARLVLRGVPPDAIVLLDGRRIRGSVMELEPGRRQLVTVQKTGFRTWADTLRPREGQRLTREVTLVALAQTPAAPVPTDTGQPQPTQAQAQPQVQQAAAPTQPAPQAAQPAGQPAPTPTAPAAPAAAQPSIAYITMGSRPNAAMTINGRPVAANPVTNYEVPAGLVRVRFQVTDSAGIWTVDTSFTVAAGERRNFGRVPLRRP